jgi:hypothetical protein
MKTNFSYSEERVQNLVLLMTTNILIFLGERERESQTYFFGLPSHKMEIGNDSLVVGYQHSLVIFSLPCLLPQQSASFSEAFCYGKC